MALGQSPRPDARPGKEAPKIVVSTVDEFGAQFDGLAPSAQAPGEDPSPQALARLEQHDAKSRARQFARGREPRNAPADHDDIRVWRHVILDCGRGQGCGSRSRFHHA